MKNIIRAFIIVAIAVGLWSVMQLTASADTTNAVMYKDSDGNISAAPECKIVESSGQVEWDGGWYAVTKNTVITGRVTIKNGVNLILCDGAKLIVSPENDDIGINMISHKLNVFEGKTIGKYGGTLDVSGGNDKSGIRTDGELGIFGGTVLVNYDSDTHTAKKGRSFGIDSAKTTIGGGATVCACNGQSRGVGIDVSRELKIYGSDTRVYANCSVNGDKVSLTEGAGGVGIACYGQMEITDAVVYSCGGAAPSNNERGSDGIMSPIKMSGLSSLTAVGGEGAKTGNKYTTNGGDGIKGNVEITEGTPTILATGGNGAVSGAAIHGKMNIPSSLMAFKSTDGVAWKKVGSDEMSDSGILNQYAFIASYSPVTSETNSGSSTIARAKVTEPGKTKVKKAIKRKKSPKKISVKLKKVKGAKGYQIAVYKNKKNAKKNKKSIKKKYSSKTKFTVKSKKFKKLKKIYIRARAYTLDGKKKLFGKWSKVKKVKR